LGIRLWEVATGAPIGPFLRHGARDETSTETVSAPTAAAFSPDGKLLATIGEDGKAQIWDASNANRLGDPLECSRSPLASVAFSPDSTRLAVGTLMGAAPGDGTVTIWDVATRQVLGTSFVAPEYEVQRVRPSIRELMFSPDGKTLVVMAWVTAHILDAENGQQKIALNLPASAWKGSFQDLAISPDGKQVAVASTNWLVHIWDAATANPIGTPLLHEARIRAIAFSPDGKLLASGSNDRTVRLWDTATGRQIGRPMQHQAAVESVAFSPDGKRLLGTANDTRIWQIDYDTYPSLEPQHGSVVGVSAQSDCGKLRATINEDFDVDLIRTDSKNTRATTIPGEGALAIALSPDSRHVAIGNVGWDATVWDIATIRKLQSYSCSEKVSAVAFSDAGNLLAAGLLNGNVEIWNMATGSPHGIQINHNGPVWEVAFSPDGNLLATVFGLELSKLEMKIWDISLDAPVLGVQLPFRVPRFSGALEHFRLTGKIYVGSSGENTRIEWRLPQFPTDLADMRLRTWAALGMRQGLQRMPTMIPAQEWIEIFKQQSMGTRPPGTARESDSLTN
jgi:WD40 repeat protein